VIEAAGAVLWRRGSGGLIEVAVIGRPKYGDWTLPKGKLHQGEDLLEAALREVEEETGQRARPGRFLGETRYVFKGDDKVVSYWAMEALGGDFVPGDEVDEVRWLPVDSAAAILSYERDRELLERFSTGEQP
jgi:8-oxo-dGTP diphosphatase